MTISSNFVIFTTTQFHLHELPPMLNVVDFSKTSNQKFLKCEIKSKCWISCCTGLERTETTKSFLFEVKVFQ